MNRPLLLAHLAQVERHIRKGERHLLRQRQIVDALERHGRGQSQTAKMARDILDLFEIAQAAHHSCSSAGSGFVPCKLPVNHFARPAIPAVIGSWSQLDTKLF